MLAVVLLNWERLVEGPETMLQAPVPWAGLLAAKVAEPVAQMVWSGPALETEGTVQKFSLA